MEASLAIDIQSLAPGLQAAEDGVWRYPNPPGTVSYPEDGNAFCAALEDRSFWFQHRNRCLLAAMQAFPPPGLLLDAGGGNGCVTASLQQAGIACALLEPGPQGIDNARRRGVRPLIQATLQEACFRPGALPAIGLFDVLEHIEDDEEFLKLANGLLIQGGRLYLTAPAHGFLWSTADVDAGHYRRYSLGGMAQLLEAAGFQVEYQTYFFSSLLLPVIFLRALPSRLGWRKGGALESYQAELAQKDGWSSRWLSRSLRFETRRIRQRKRIPTGSSLLVVAAKSRS